MVKQESLSNLLGFDKSNTEGQIWGGWCASDFLDNVEVVSSQERKDDVSAPPLNTLSNAKHICAKVYLTLILQKTSIHKLVRKISGTIFSPFLESCVLFFRCWLA